MHPFQGGGGGGQKVLKQKKKCDVELQAELGVYERVWNWKRALRNICDRHQVLTTESLSPACATALYSHHPALFGCPYYFAQ